MLIKKFKEATLKMYYMDHLSLLVYKTCHPSVVFFFAILKVCLLIKIDTSLWPEF